MVDIPNQESEPSVMKIDVTPQSPLIPQPQKNIPYARPVKKNRNNSNLIKAIIAIVIIAIAAFVIFSSAPKVKAPSSTTATTTIIQQNLSAMTSCHVINSPGSYYITANIKDSNESGACISIDSSNVNLVCNGNKIIGSGPYVDVPPFSYGIEIDSRHNVTINGCFVNSFSYGAYVVNSTDVNILNSNITSNFVNNIYFNNTSFSSIRGDYAGSSAGPTGSIYIGNNSYENKILNNTILFNRFYGIYINSRNNTISNNYINGTPQSFYCVGSSGFSNSNFARGNVCFNNTGCGFVTCKGINTPTNLTQIRLGRNIASCGAIVSPGSYRMEASLNMNNYINSSSPFVIQYGIPCISIMASGVSLDCNGHSISNATFAGISAKGVSNISISNCSINHSSFGILLSNVSHSSIYNVSASKSTVAFAIENSSLSQFSNIRAYDSGYGIYLKGSSANLFNNFNASFNNVGIYVSTSLGNSFNGGLANNNTKLDVYASLDSANSTYNLMQNTRCTFTNAQWATCPQRISPNLVYKPVVACMNIKTPGNYTMLNNIQTQSGRCIVIASSNVHLNCNNMQISGPFGSGIGIQLGKVNNVTINNCDIQGFNDSIYAKGSNSISILGFSSSQATYGLNLQNVSNSYIAGGTIIGPKGAGILLNDSFNNTVRFQTISGGKIGILLINSSLNGIYSNNGSINYIGLELNGLSFNNTIQNNTMESNSYSDYACYGPSAANAEYGGINYGTKKIGCLWLAASPIGNIDVACTSFNQPSQYSITHDGIYPYGYRCFGVYANNTAIDCYGHTIIATSGGTFAYFKNAQNAVVEDCVLKGFTSPIVAYNSSVSVINDTIISNTSSSTAINVTRSQNPVIEYNNVTSYIGISVSGSSGGKIQNNVVGNAAIAYMLRNSSQFNIKGNTALQTSTVAMQLLNSTFNTFQNNNFYSLGGIQCTYSSTGKQSNTDLGGNICEANQNCNWVTSQSCR
ncbi:MAG: right-handed parallel beta-helix repeat-containing protein [Candidatus Micrarchaeia archaeon]